MWRVDTSIIGFVKDKKQTHIFQFPEKFPACLDKHNNGAFTLGVRDSSVESPNTMLGHLGLKLTYHENFVLS
jgi:hypothetical protein